MAGEIVVDVVILYSGGADSRLMLELARRMNKEIFAVVMDYTADQNGF